MDKVVLLLTFAFITGVLYLAGTFPTVAVIVTVFIFVALKWFNSN